MTAKDFTELIAWQRADELEKFALEQSEEARANSRAIELRVNQRTK